MTMNKFFPLILVTSGVIFLAEGGCGPKKGEKGSKNASGEKQTQAGKKQGGDLLAEALDLLNKAIAEGNEAAAEDLIGQPTLNLLKDTVSFSPEDKGGGIQNAATADILDFEKKNGVTYARGEPDPDTGSDTIQIIEGDAVVASGPVAVSKEGGRIRIDFEQAAQQRLEKIQSDGILRQKYLDVIDAVNKVIEEGAANDLKNLITITTLNLELEVRSYSVKYKKNLSLQLMVDTWKSSGASFEITDVDIQAQTAMMKLAGDKGIIYQGKCAFITEIGKLKLDFSDILKARIEEIKAAEKASKGKKKK
jgi:hypothetical protein